MVLDIARLALDRFVGLMAAGLSSDTVRELTEFRLDAATQSYLDQLADKANVGCLTDAERAEYSSYIEVLDLIGILQASVRRVGCRS
jgi:hypothetical protein